mgnify:CR=1 FL=1
MNRIKLRCYTTISAILLSFTAFADIEQSCGGSTTTTASTDFTFSDDEMSVVYHSSTELMWARCVVGQTWNDEDSVCEGEPVRLSWQLALQLSNSYENGSYSDWRLPNLKELAPTVEHACVSPSINASIFPNSPSGNYWTSTPNTSADKTDEAWAIAFSNGRIDSREKQQDYYVRMVRYAE